jgi:hypothetical protein
VQGPAAYAPAVTDLISPFDPLPLIDMSEIQAIRFFISFIILFSGRFLKNTELQKSAGYSFLFRSGMNKGQKSDEECGNRPYIPTESISLPFRRRIF